MKRKVMRRIVYALCFSLLFQLAGIPVFADSLIPAGEKTAVARSDNNNLSGLKIDGGTLIPAFNANQTEYVVVGDGTGTPIIATATAEEAEIVIRGYSSFLLVEENRCTIPPSPDQVSFEIQVTAKNGIIKTYHVTVYNNYIYTENPLTGLDVMIGSLTPEYTVNSFIEPSCYAIQVENEVNVMELRATGPMMYGGIYFEYGAPVIEQPTINGVLGWLFLAEGFNKFEFQVNDIGYFDNSSMDPRTSHYSIIVYREAASVPSSGNNDLSGLTLSEGSLTPVFDPEELTYTATVANDTSAITVTGTAADGKATVSVDGGSAIKEIALVDKTTEITIVVTSEDSKVKTYTVRVTKEAKKTAGRVHPLVSERTVGGRTIARFDDLRFGLIVQRDESGLVDYRVRLRSKVNDVRLQIPYADVMTKITKGARDLVMSYQGHEIRIPMSVFEGDWLAGMPCETESTFEIHLAVDEAGQTTYTIDFFVIEQINEKTRLVHRRTVQK